MVNVVARVFVKLLPYLIKQPKVGGIWKCLEDKVGIVLWQLYKGWE